MVNREPADYRRVSADDLLQAAQRLFRPERENVLIVRNDE
jgi:hypothetical protein